MTSQKPTISLFFLTLLLPFCSFSTAKPNTSPDVCQKLKSAVKQGGDDIIQVNEYRLPTDAKGFNITVSNSTDCKDFKKMYTKVDPDLIRCRNGNLVSILPASEIPRSVSCLKAVTCYQKRCFTTVTTLIYKAPHHPATQASPAYSFFDFSTPPATPKAQ